MELTRQQKYAYLQRTAWKDMATTTYGHISATTEAAIDEAYAKQIEVEAEAANPKTPGTGHTDGEPVTQTLQAGSEPVNEAAPQSGNNEAASVAVEDKAETGPSSVQG